VTSGQLRSCQGKPLSCAVQTFGRVICLLNTLDLTLNSINALNGTNDARGCLAAHFAQRLLEVVMDSRKVQLSTQIRAAQDEQKVDQFLEVFDITEAEKIACHLPF